MQCLNFVIIHCENKTSIISHCAHCHSQMVDEQHLCNTQGPEISHASLKYHMHSCFIIHEVSKWNLVLTFSFNTTSTIFFNICSSSPRLSHSTNTLHLNSSFDNSWFSLQNSLTLIFFDKVVIVKWFEVMGLSGPIHCSGLPDCMYQSRVYI